MIDRLQLRAKAEDLRRQGWLYGYISKELNVPKATVYGWVSKMELTDEQQILVRASLHKVQLQKVSHLAKHNRVRTQARDENIQAEARKIVEALSLNKQGEQLLCSLLFWCEGGKDIRSGVQFINSDPTMVRVFMKAFRNSFALDESKFRAIIHLHEYHDPELQLRFWANITGIPQKQFYRPYLKPHTGKQKKENYPGCVSIRYLDRGIGKTLQMIYTEFGQIYRGVR